MLVDSSYQDYLLRSSEASLTIAIAGCLFAISNFLIFSHDVLHLLVDSMKYANAEQDISKRERARKKSIGSGQNSVERRSWPCLDVGSMKRERRRVLEHIIWSTSYLLLTVSCSAEG